MSLEKLKQIVPSWVVKSQQLSLYNNFMKKHFGTDIVKILTENYEKSLKNKAIYNNSKQLLK